MNIRKDMFHLAFISLLILNMLLIFFGVFSHFFNVKDYTLIAGIIGFFGAIIGGFITWLGVRYTISENKKEKEIEYIPKQVSYLRSEVNNLFKLLLIYDTHKLDNEADCKEVTVKYQEFLERNMNSTLLFYRKELLHEHQKISDKMAELTIHFAVYNFSSEKDQLSKEYLIHLGQVHELVMEFRKKIELECDILLELFYSK